MIGFKKLIGEWLDRKVIRPHCAICGDREWHYEDAATAFSTIDDARPTLLQVEQDNLATNRVFTAGRN